MTILHIRVTYINEIKEQLELNGIETIYGGTSRDLPRLLIGLLIYPLAQISRLFYGKIMFRGLWYVYSFEDKIIGKRIN